MMIEWEMIGALVGFIGLVITIILSWDRLRRVPKALRFRSVRPEAEGTPDQVPSFIEAVGLKAVEPVDYGDYYDKEHFLTVPSQPENPIYHAEVFRNTQGLNRSKFRFMHGRDFHICDPVFAELEEQIANRLKYNETRLRVAKIGLGEGSLQIYCQKATYAQVLVTNHSDELAFDGKSLRDVFAPSTEGRLPPLEDSLAANPAGCNCLLETTDNYLVIQDRSGEVETSKFLHAPSVSGGTEYWREYSGLDPFRHLSIEMWEEIGIGRRHLVCDPLLLAISRDVQRNGLPEFFFYAKLILSFDEVRVRMRMRQPRNSWEHTGIFALPAEERRVVGYIVKRESSLALKANLAYYLELLDVIRERCEKRSDQRE